MKPLNDLTSIFKRVVVKAGFDPRRITHHCNRSVSSFSLAPIETYESGDFALREDAKSWPLLCHVDNSSGKINVGLKSHILSVTVSFFSAWLKSACYTGLTTVVKLGRKLLRRVRTSQTCFNCQLLTCQKHDVMIIWFHNDSIHSLQGTSTALVVCLSAQLSIILLPLLL